MLGLSTTVHQRFDVTSVSKGARVSAMGCGGSRTDALEPCYLESWTKETESTWLTGTDADIPLSSIHSIPSDGSEACFASEKNVPEFFEDGLPPPAQAYLKVCSTASEAGLGDLKPSGGGGGSPPDASPAQDEAPGSSGTTVQRTSVLHTEEICEHNTERRLGRCRCCPVILLEQRLRLSLSSRHTAKKMTCRVASSPTDKMAGQPHVHQAGDHHGDAEHPPSGQERQGEEVADHLRGNEARRGRQRGGGAQHLSGAARGLRDSMGALFSS